MSATSRVRFLAYAALALALIGGPAVHPAHGSVPLCRYPELCGTICNYLSSSGFCEPWLQTYPPPDRIMFVAKSRTTDCDGNTCERHQYIGIDPVMLSSYGECVENHAYSETLNAYTAALCGFENPGAPFAFPEAPPCDSICCMGDAGGGGAAGGGSTGSPHGPEPIALFAPPAHSPAPGLSLYYDPATALNRGLGAGWSHTYMYSLHESDETGIVIARTARSAFAWIYAPDGSGAYQSAPYDRTVLTHSGSGFTARAKDATRYRYNVDGRLEAIEDRNANRLSLSYAAAGLLERVADDFGRELWFAYDGDGLLASVTDANDSTYTFTYAAADDGLPNLTRITYPDGTARQFEYAEAHVPHGLTRIIDNNGMVAATYAYDTLGRIIRRGGAPARPVVQFDYTPDIDEFSDAFDGALSAAWTHRTGLAGVAADPVAGGTAATVAHIRAGRLGYTAAAPGEKLKLSFDVLVTAATQDFTIRLFDSARGEQHGPVIRYSAAHGLSAELDHAGLTHTLAIPVTLSRNRWTRVEIQADAREHAACATLWINCEKIGGWPFKRAAQKIDSIAIASASEIHIDTVTLQRTIMDGSVVVQRDDQGSSELKSIEKPNRYGGETWQYQREAGSAVACDTCVTIRGRRYEFDAARNVRRMVDANGIATAMSFDERGNMLTRTEAAGTEHERTAHFTYHPYYNDVLTETVASADTPGRTKTISYAYDTAGNRTAETVTGYSRGQMISRTTHYAYNSRGQLTTVDGPRTDVSDTVSYTHDPVHGYLSAIDYPNGRVTYGDFDGNHRPQVVTDHNGTVVRYTYDYSGRELTREAGAARSEYAYDAVGTIDSIARPGGAMISYDYDGQYRVVRMTDDLGNSIAYDYDSHGNTIREEYLDSTDAITKFQEFDYDHAGRLLRTGNPDNSFSLFDYDNNTNRTRMVDPLGNVTLYTYDVLNRLTSVTQAAGTPDEAITVYDWDLHDNLVRVTDAEGAVTRYDYDDFGNLIRTVSPDTGTTEYYYDAAGNLIDMTDARGIGLAYTYDALNRLTRIDYPHDPATVYTYDDPDTPYSLGRLTRIMDASGVTRYEYDEYGNVTAQHTTVDAHTYTTRYAYSLNNELLILSAPWGQVIEYERNSLGRIESISLQAGGTLVSDMDYAPFGELARMRYSRSGGQLHIERDLLYRIKGITAADVVERTYTHDFTGNITSIAQHAGDTLPSPGTESGPATTVMEPGTNRISRIERPEGERTYTYDAAGNVLSDGLRGYTYNDAGRLSAVDMHGRTQYVYNTKGQRVKKIRAGGDTTIYHYDLAGNLMAESTPGGAMLALYIYADGERVAMLLPDGSLYYYHNDHLGTPLAMTDHTGSKVWSASYTAFGEARVDQSSSITNNFRFPGQYYDEETGLHYNYHRYYDPATGRYLRPDPIGLRGGMNLYFYVNNNPIKYTDPKGLDKPGCSVEGLPFGAAIKKILEYTRCGRYCCAVHDKCYSDNKCTQKSWGLNICFGVIAALTSKCARCNYNAVNCFKICLINPNYVPPGAEGEYYCAQCGEYFYGFDPHDPQGPHFGHSTDPVPVPPRQAPPPTTNAITF